MTWREREVNDLRSTVRDANTANEFAFWGTYLCCGSKAVEATIEFGLHTSRIVTTVFLEKKRGEIWASSSRSLPRRWGRAGHRSVFFSKISAGEACEPFCVFWLRTIVKGRYVEEISVLGSFVVHSIAISKCKCGLVNNRPVSLYMSSTFGRQGSYHTFLNTDMRFAPKMSS